MAINKYHQEMTVRIYYMQLYVCMFASQQNLLQSAIVNLPLNITFRVDEIINIHNQLMILPIPFNPTGIKKKCKNQTTKTSGRFTD